MSKTILITGANRGIGLAMTYIAANRGNKVIACCRKPTEADALNSFSKENDNVTIRSLDVTQESHASSVSLSITDAIDTLVCNAGSNNGYGGIYSKEHNAESIERVFMTNVAGVFFTARAFLDHLKRSSSGKIAIISSLMGSQKHTSCNAYIYRASKAAVNNIMVSLSNELKDHNIAVAAYHPGWVRTDMGGPNADLSSDQSAQQLLDRFEELSIEHSGTFQNFDGKPLEL